MDKRVRDQTVGNSIDKDPERVVGKVPEKEIVVENGQTSKANMVVEKEEPYVPPPPYKPPIPYP